MLAAVKSMQTATKEHSYVFYLTSLEGPNEKPIVQKDNRFLYLNGSLSPLNFITIKYLENLHLFYSFMFSNQTFYYNLQGLHCYLKNKW